MATIGSVANWAAIDLLNRPDLLPKALLCAKRAYLSICGKVPFPELHQRSAELAISTDSDTETILDISTLDPRVAGIQSCRITLDTNKFRRVKRSHPRSYDSIGSFNTSPPATYARQGNTLEFYPPADKTTYTIRLRYWSLPTMQTDVATTGLVTPPEWDELVEWETLYRLYFFADRGNDALALMAPAQMPRQAWVKKTTSYEMGIIPRLWNDLLQTSQMREGVDEEFSINPRYRQFTNTRSGR